mmetsp:Transcript_1337/g.2500  ORF Transcript_1337/g.2500 Transcript_1337/m.2500 type:complete len:167 (+) Transcript_1337:3-503(+)
MQYLAARREAQEEALGPKADFPKPLIKLRGRTPQTPAADQTTDWGREARDIEQKALVRLLHGLKDRLGKEQERTLSVEAKLARKKRRPPSGTSLQGLCISSTRFDELGPTTKASSLSRAKSCGWYPSHAAGFAPADEASRPLPSRPLARLDRVMACPYATAYPGVD